MLVNKLTKEERLNQSQALQTVGLARSTYHYQSTKGSRKERFYDPALCETILAVRKQAQVYGYRKTWARLRALGWLVNKKRVLRYARHLGLLQPRKIKGQSFTRPAMVRPVVSNVYWEEDLTPVWCGDQTGYLFAVIDGCDKELPGEHFGDRCRSDEAADVMEQAVRKRFNGPVPPDHRLVLRIDRGTQFTARKFRERARTLNVILEYAGIKCPDDKPYIEAFFSKYKIEEVYRNEYRNLAEAKAGWELYRVWHENERVHQSLGYRTPHEIYEMHKVNLALQVKMTNIYQVPLCPE
ncbi:MAG TPA: IS3 family transposase [bacterium]|jgi:transposase InsO family protein